MVIKLKHLLMGLAGIVVIGMLGIGWMERYSSSMVPTTSRNLTKRIVIDAGHGFPDGGASVGDVLEADLNLAIAMQLKEALIERDYEVIMTREDEKAIADPDQQHSLSEMKQSDLSNRVKIMNESEADFGISIHMNQYTNAKYWGWQTFYRAKSEEGKRLAEWIQKKIEEVMAKKNERTALKIDGIKIVDKTTIPVVIVECGFLSNPEECQLLQTKAYQEKLVEGICEGIEAYEEECIKKN